MYRLSITNDRHPLELGIIERMCFENQLEFTRLPDRVIINLPLWDALVEVRKAIRFMTGCGTEVISPLDDRDQT